MGRKMGKTSKRKLKWRSLELDTSPKCDVAQSGEKSQAEVHPFLKIISKNMDAIVKKDSTANAEESKLVYLYRSDKKVSVCDPQDLTQYAGKPIQYTPLQQTQGDGTHQYTADQQAQQPMMYQPYHSYTPPVHSPEMFIPPIAGQVAQTAHPLAYPMYCSTQQTNQQVHYQPVHQIPYFQHPVHPPDLPHQPHLPQVEYVPYYYYYPVPAHPNPNQEYHSSVSMETQPPLSDNIHSGSTTSCDSCLGEEKVIRRRKKKKKSAEDVEDVDSGYFNGADSSSEPNSEEEVNVLKSSNKAGNRGKDYCKNEKNGENEKEITNLLIKQIQNPTIDFQFGEVQEILDELNKTKSDKKEEIILTHVEKEISDEQVLTQSEINFKVSKSLENTSDLLVDSEHKTVETESIKPISIKSENMKEGKQILSKAKRKKKNKKNKILADITLNSSESAMVKSEETTLDTETAPSTEIWTTVGKSRKNKFSHQATGLEDNIGAFHESQVDLEAEYKENIKNKPEETDTVNKSFESKEINSSSEVPMKDIETLDKITRVLSKKDKQKKKLKAKSNEIPDKKETKIPNDEHKNISQPLEDMKELFYQEKAVEIIKLQPEDSSKNKSSRVEKNKSKTKKIAKMSKSPKIEEIPNKAQNDNDNLMAELMGMNFPVLFFHPFMNFEDQLLQDQSSHSKQANKSKSPKLKESSVKERIHYNPHPMTFLDPSFSPHMISDYSHLIVGGKTGLHTKKANHDEDLPRESLEQLEEHLVDMKVLSSQNSHAYLKSGKNRVVMLRPQNPYGESRIKASKKSPAKKTEVPGPRLKYSPVLRSGPLGVRRQVVPPSCLARRFTRI